MSERLQHHPAAWESLAAGACFAVAVISLALGFVFTTHWLLDDRLHPFLHTLGLVLLIIGLPVMMLGAHCLDLQEKKLNESKSGKKSKSTHIVALVSVVAILFVHSAAVNAQQTIFNVPTTDVLDKGKIYAELDASRKPMHGLDVPKFSSFVPRVVRRSAMLDVVFIGTTIGFFVIALAYVHACEKLRGGERNEP
jgi:uncharacterized membrane protein YidH (DUF202 family)